MLNTGGGGGGYSNDVREIICHLWIVFIACFLFLWSLILCEVAQGRDNDRRSQWVVGFVAKV